MNEKAMMLYARLMGRKDQRKAELKAALAEKDYDKAETLIAQCQAYNTAMQDLLEIFGLDKTFVEMDL